MTANQGYSSDLGVQGSPAVLGARQLPLYQEVLEDPIDLWDLEDQPHLKKPTDRRGEGREGSRLQT